MNALLEKLHDIEGIDPIDWWPLALGWWFVAALIVGLSIWIGYKIAFYLSWKGEALKKLKELEKRLQETNAKQVLIDLSEYLKRIAMHRFPRTECAGLNGEAWLVWLAEHDPKGFDWKMHGEILVSAPYAPIAPSAARIKPLIQAAKKWVR